MISHKRWENNDRWLKAYEDDFVKTHGDTNPFFKEINKKSTFQENYKKRSFAEVVKDNGFAKTRQNPQNAKQNNTSKYQHNNQGGARQTTEDQELKGLLQQLLTKMNGHNGRQYQQKTNYQRQGRQWRNTSNNSNLHDENGGASSNMLEDFDSSFLEADHNWNSRN